mmetsp:Transcript_5327/g.9340  ORF Transcript_5327/g.9340 Transcript_5327/m.9340 type:complete len:278 (-) Transcript_5327:298-1131(-)
MILMRCLACKYWRLPVCSHGRVQRGRALHPGQHLLVGRAPCVQVHHRQPQGEHVRGVALQRPLPEQQELGRRVLQRGDLRRRGLPLQRLGGHVRRAKVCQLHQVVRGGDLLPSLALRTAPRAAAAAAAAAPERHVVSAPVHRVLRGRRPGLHQQEVEQLHVVVPQAEHPLGRGQRRQHLEEQRLRRPQRQLPLRRPAHRRLHVPAGAQLHHDVLVVPPVARGRPGRLLGGSAAQVLLPLRAGVLRVPPERHRGVVAAERLDGVQEVAPLAPTSELAQ